MDLGSVNLVVEGEASEEVQGVTIRVERDAKQQGGVLDSIRLDQPIVSP